MGCKITEQEKGRDGKAGAVLVEDPGELESAEMESVVTR